MPNTIMTPKETCKAFADEINAIPDKRIQKAVLEWLSRVLFMKPRRASR